MPVLDCGFAVNLRLPLSISLNGPQHERGQSGDEGDKHQYHPTYNPPKSEEISILSRAHAFRELLTDGVINAKVTCGE